METADDADILHILIATDNHLGFAEKDPIRKRDSLETFEEILAIAKANNVSVCLVNGSAVQGVLRGFERERERERARERERESL